MRLLFIFSIIFSLFLASAGKGHDMQKRLEINQDMSIEEVKKQVKELLVGQDVTAIETLISPQHDYHVAYYGKDNYLVINISFQSSEVKVPFSSPAALIITTYLIKMMCDDGKMSAIKEVERWLTGP